MGLEQELQKINKQKVIVVGDVGLDEYVNGSVKRISPEAPVPVVEVAREEVRLGLATFVAQNIATLGGVPLLVSVIGEDKTADVLCGLLKENGISEKYLTRDSSRPTTRKMRIMSEHHHVVRIDYEHRRFLSPEIQKKVLSNVKDLLPTAQGIVIQDYAKGVLSESCIQEIIREAKKSKVTVMVDPHRTTPVGYYKGADIMTPNTEEAILLSQLPIDDLRKASDGLVEVGQELMNKIGSEKMIITRGKDGIALFERSKVEYLPTVAREVFDVTGAGDTVIATLALAVAANVPLKAACELANHAAGVVVAKIGCVPCTRAELAAWCQTPSVR